MAKPRSTVRYLANSFAWGAISKLLDAGIKFLTIPLLLSHFGKENYGILTLAIATNAYMALLDMGMNTGAVRFFSQWIAAGRYDLLHRTAQTNITFYLGISLINSLVLLVLGIWGARVFQISTNEFGVFRSMLFLLAVFSVVNWVVFVFNQLLIADEKIAFVQQITCVKSILSLVAVGVVVFYNWSLIHYFVIYLAVNSIVVFPYLYLCKKRNLIASILPAFYWQDFRVVFNYGLAILAMGMFQFTATQSRPIILGMFSNDGVGILTEYRVIEVFPIFILSLGGLLISIFLPKTSKAIQNGDRATIERMAYEGTKYTSILVTILCFPVMLSAKELISLYVGDDYAHLSQWLVIWVFTLTLFLHNTPVASLILATGRTRMLVISSAIASVVSMIVNVLLTNKHGVGSAVIGYLLYIIIQVSFYYFYFNNRVLRLNSMRVFKSFFIPTGLGFIVFLGVQLLKFDLDSLVLQAVVNTISWGVIYVTMLIAFKVVDVKKLRFVLKIGDNTF